MRCGSPRKAKHRALKAQKYFWKISIWRETVIWRETAGGRQQKCPCCNKENACQCSDWMNLQGKQIPVLERHLNIWWPLSHSSSAFKDQHPGWTVAQAAVPQLCAQACRGAGTALTQPVPQPLHCCTGRLQIRVLKIMWKMHFTCFRQLAEVLLSLIFTALRETIFQD